MAVLVWKHGTTRAAAREAVQAELRQLGYDDKVTWKGDAASASVGLGAILSARGQVTDEAIVLDECGGVAGALVLGRCREMLEGLFPGGEVA